MQVLGDEPEYSSCHGRVIATLDYMWYSETPHPPSASDNQGTRSPTGDQSILPNISQPAQSSAAGPADIQNGNSLSPRGLRCFILILLSGLKQLKGPTMAPWCCACSTGWKLREVGFFTQQGSFLGLLSLRQSRLWATSSAFSAEVQHSNHRQRARQQAIACELPDISEDSELPAPQGENEASTQSNLSLMYMHQSPAHHKCKVDGIDDSA